MQNDEWGMQNEEAIWWGGVAAGVVPGEWRTTGARAPVCLDWKTGKTLWTAKDRIGQGGSLVRVAPDRLLMFSEIGKATLARATPKGDEKLAEAQVVERTGG